MERQLDGVCLMGVGGTQGPQEGNTVVSPGRAGVCTGTASICVVVGHEEGTTRMGGADRKWEGHGVGVRGVEPQSA